MLEVLARLRDMIVAIALAWVGVTITSSGSETKPANHPANRPGALMTPAADTAIATTAMTAISAKTSPACMDRAQASTTLRCLDGAACPPDLAIP
jgi:hypothetical protein